MDERQQEAAGPERNPGDTPPVQSVPGQAAPRPSPPRLSPIELALDFSRYCLQRFGKDGCTGQAAGLSYASLLALVPLLVIGLAVLSAFPSLADSEQQIKALFYGLLTPTGQEELVQYLDGFLANARRMTAPGVLALGVTALLLLSNINGALNAVWRVSERRPLATRLLVYWALLTLGPLLVGASLTISSLTFALVQQAESVMPGSFFLLQRLLSISLTAGGLTLLYYLVPNRRSALYHALLGGVVAAVLLEVLKFGFGLYVIYFPSYQAIYGALAAIPLFFVWMYIAWAAVLLGAEVAAALPEWTVARWRERGSQEDNRKLLLALSLLARLREVARHDSQGLKPAKLLAGLPVWPEELERTLSCLRAKGLLARTNRGGRVVLSRDLRHVTLDDLCAAVGLGLGSQAAEAWAPQAQAVLQAFARSTDHWRRQDLESLLATSDGDTPTPPVSESRIG